MAKFNFRHGIARMQEDGNGNPNFLRKNSNYVDMVVSPDPTVFLIAHKDANYMFTENATVLQAWGPFAEAGSAPDYWLYWDVSFVTGELTRGFTTREPITTSVEPKNPDLDQHWFDTHNMVTKRWDGGCWLEVIRVFAAKYQSGAILISKTKGSQVGITGSESFAGTPLFDPDGKPLQVWQRNRMGQFITTETPLHAQFSRNANFRVEAAINPGMAIESIPIHHAVAYAGQGKDEIMLARNTLPKKQSIGIAAEDMIVGETRTFITKGYVSNDDWNWTEPPGTRLFVGSTGALQTTPPVIDSIQEMGQIAGPQTIYVNPQSLKILNQGSVESGNYVPMYTDRITGEEVMWDRDAIPGVFDTLGFVHNQTAAASIWTVVHNGATPHTTVEVRNTDNEIIIPFSVINSDDNTVVIDFGAHLGAGAPLVAGSALLVLFLNQ
jgi:hypothetical protein